MRLCLGDGPVIARPPIEVLAEQVLGITQEREDPEGDQVGVDVLRVDPRQAQAFAGSHVTGCRPPPPDVFSEEVRIEGVAALALR